MATGIAQLRSQWTEHLGLIVSGALFAFVVLQLVTFSGFNATTAMGVLQAGGTANVAVGIALASLPLIGAVSFTVVVARYAPAWLRKQDPERAAILAATAIPLCFVVAVVPAVTLLIPLALFSLLWLLARWQKRRADRADKSSQSTNETVSSGERSAVMIMAAIAALGSLLFTPWLPKERIQDASGSAFTGYVVGERDTQAVVKPAGSNLLVFIDKKSLKRSYCQNASAVLLRPLPEMFSQHAYPPCPERSAPKGGGPSG